MADVLQKPAGDYDPRGRLDPAGFDRHVRFHTFPPPADLAPLIEHGWSIRWDPVDDAYQSEQVMHRPYVDVFISGEQSGIQGTFRGKRTYVASGNRRIIGVRFRPGAFHAVWGGPMAELQDEIADLGRLFPGMGEGEVARLLARDDDAAVGGLFALVGALRPSPDPNIELINEIIGAVETRDDLQTVTAVAAAFGRSERWLQQLFREYVGIGLKWLLQRRTLLAAAERIREEAEPDWADLAYDLGYSSQQHFITDFRNVTGKTPVQYWKDQGTQER